MLSTAAWNAFLKTLEEPPPNTVFVLATTEADEGACDGRGPLPPLRLPPPHGRADRERRARGWPTAESIEIPPRRSPRSPARPRAASATRSGRSSSSSPTAAGRSRSRTCWRCWAWPTRGCLVETVDAVAAGDARRRCGRSRSALEQGRDAGLVRRATSRCGLRELLRRADARARYPPSCRSHPRPTRRCVSRPHASSTPRWCACSSCWGRRWRACAPARTPARAWSWRS